jgi:prevent-host-death family protein
VRIITLADAKARLSAVLDDVASGQEVVITRRGQAVARISATPSASERGWRSTKLRGRSATAWVEGLRSFVERQPRSDADGVAEMRAADRY